MTKKNSGLSNARSNDLLDGQMTPEQIQNWRTMLVGMIGPYALIMPDEEIQKFRDKLQAKVNIKNDLPNL